jgi:hypothetical protein
MSTLIRILIGIGLVTFGYHIGREVARVGPMREELEQMRGRRGETIDAKEAEPETWETNGRSSS